MVSVISSSALGKYFLDSVLDSFNFYHHINDHMIVIVYKWQLYDLYLTLPYRNVVYKTNVYKMALRLPPNEEMSEDNRNLLKSNMALFQENLCLSKLLPYMTPVLNLEDIATIRSLPTKSEQVEKFITILSEKGDEAFHCFIENISHFHSHLADCMLKEVSFSFLLLPVNNGSNQ